MCGVSPLCLRAMRRPTVIELISLLRVAVIGRRYRCGCQQTAERFAGASFVYLRGIGRHCHAFGRGAAGRDAQFGNSGTPSTRQSVARPCDDRGPSRRRAGKRPCRARREFARCHRRGGQAGRRDGGVGYPEDPRRGLCRAARQLARPYNDLQGASGRADACRPRRPAGWWSRAIGRSRGRGCQPFKPLAATKGRVLVNIDNKLESTDLPGIVAVARGLGMEEQVVVKQNLWNMKRVAGQGGATCRRPRRRLHFMPIIADDAVNDARFVEAVNQGRSRRRCRDDRLAGQFSGHVRRPAGSCSARDARRGGARRLAPLGQHLRDRQQAWRLPCGGRGDELAVHASRRPRPFGFWAERGATIIQTDEPKAAIEWLEANGYRIPYDLTN